MIYFSESSKSNVVIDVHKENISPRASLSSNVTGVSGAYLDIKSWLPLCASTMSISPNFNDYILIPTVTLLAGGKESAFPNSNSDHISTEVLLQWDYELHMARYRTLKACPLYIEHANTDLSQSRGVVADVYLSPLKGYRGNFSKLVSLMAFDRSKDPKLVEDLLSRQINSYSCGAHFSAYTCSDEGHRIVHTDERGSRMTRPGIPAYSAIIGGKECLIYRNLLGSHNGCKGGLKFFEQSVVRTPAFCSALSDIILQ